MSAKKIKATTGTYFATKDKKFTASLLQTVEGTVRETDMWGDSHFPQVVNPAYNPDAELVPPKSCEVCAIGATFICALDRNDSLKVSEVAQDRHVGYDGKTSLDEDGMMEYLGKWFSEKQLRLIECAFEGEDVTEEFTRWSDRLEDDVVSAPAKRAIALYKVARASKRLKGTKPEKVMKAIMHNVIRNDGTFKP